MTRKQFLRAVSKGEIKTPVRCRIIDVSEARITLKTVISGDIVYMFPQEGVPLKSGEDVFCQRVELTAPQSEEHVLFYEQN